MKSGLAPLLKNWKGYLTAVINFERQEKALVVTCGKGYIVDTLARLLVNTEVVEGITCVIKDEVRQRVIFSNGFNLQLIDTAGHISVLLDKYFFDEIEFIEFKEDILFAKYWYHKK
jgi:hypothetical protein